MLKRIKTNRDSAAQVRKAKERDKLAKECIQLLKQIVKLLGGDVE